MKIKQNDTIQVIAGKERGKTGSVLKVITNNGISKVVVDGLNMKKHHNRGQGSTPGQMIEVPAPIAISNVALIDPKTNKPTRVGYKFVGDKKVRIAKKSGNEIK